MSARRAAALLVLALALTACTFDDAPRSGPGAATAPIAGEAVARPDAANGQPGADMPMAQGEPSMTLVPAGAAATEAPATVSGPRTVVLALDGLDHGRTAALLARGELPNLARLASVGPLQTLVPVQSPATWAAFNTGRNPGVTGVPGFVGRTFGRGADGEARGTPIPFPLLGYAVEVPCHDIPGVTSAPYEANPNQGVPWWRHLDAAGVRFLGLQLAMSAPPDEEGPHTRLLSGLGVKDISGSPGSWSVYTDDPWSWEKSTNTAGQIRKVYFDGMDGLVAETALVGPRDWVAVARAESRLAELDARILDTSPGSMEAEQATAARDVARRDLRALQKERRTAEVPMRLVADRDAGTLRVQLPEAEVSLAVGEWSELLPVTFLLDDEVEVFGQVQFHLIRCDEDDVRVFVPPIELDSARPPSRPPLSAPARFAAELSDGIGGRFHTLGWAAPTNPLKDSADSQFGPGAFLAGVTRLFDERARLLDWALERPAEWDVFVQVFSGTDRVGHLLMREADPEHPLHDADYAATPVEAFGEQIPLSQAVDASYRAADRLVGRTLDAIESGALGDDALLLVVSDHGMQSFRRGVNLNTLLWQFGWLKTVDDTPPGEATESFLAYVDWERTQAYSLGLGKVFLNLRGREPGGIVPAEQAEAVAHDIAEDLRSVQDGEGGPWVVTSVHTRDALFDGPWVREGRDLTRRWAGEDHPLPHWDGFADLFVGFAPGYRIDWTCTMGGMTAEPINDNSNHWSGGHVSVDPSHVPGVLGSNRPLSSDAPPGLLDIGPTILRRHGVDPATAGLEGHELTVGSMR